MQHRMEDDDLEVEEEGPLEQDETELLEQIRRQKRIRKQESIREKTSRTNNPIVSRWAIPIDTPPLTCLPVLDSIVRVVWIRWRRNSQNWAWIRVLSWKECAVRRVIADVVVRVGPVVVRRWMRTPKRTALHGSGCIPPNRVRFLVVAACLWPSLRKAVG